MIELRDYKKLLDMKMIKYLLSILSLFILFYSCNDGIDPISYVDPGPDEMAPSVTIKYPQEGTQIRVLEEVTSIKIEFQVVDDIEIGEVVLLMDGDQIASFSDFKDYRRAIDEFTYDNVTNGEHQLTVKATDLSGKSTEKMVTFEKVSPYEPLYEGEILYMPFNGDYIDLINLQPATVVGNPGFAGESVIMGDGENAYAGAEGSYLTLPGENYQSETFSAVFWMKVNAMPDRAGVLVMGPPDPNNPDNMNNRKSGFRFFRENAGGMQRFKLNVGNGEADTWFDGGAAADVDPAQDEWVHMAFTIDADKASVYIDGQLVKEGEFAGVDWTGCDVLSIMSGAPRFVQWGHLSDQSYMDELRLFNRSLSEQEIRDIIAVESGEIVTGYKPRYGEIFAMPFENKYVDLATGMEATIEGTPGFIDGVMGMAYKGTEGSYLTFPTGTLTNEEFSASFWMDINADPDRAGILVIGPPDPDKPDTPNNRKSGFRFFREKAGDNQRFKLNVGNGEKDTWVDGGEASDVDPTTNDWVHFVFTISQNKAVVYINGEVAKEQDLEGLDWSGCDVLSIMSGAPRFVQWGHLSDQSALDDLLIFDRVLTQEEVQNILEDAS